jgi:hypothetical protein
VGFLAQPGRNALIARDEFGQVFADEFADVRRRRARRIERLELRREQVELDADAVDELACRRGKRRALRLEPDFGAAGALGRSCWRGSGKGERPNSTATPISSTNSARRPMKPKGWISAPNSAAPISTIPPATRTRPSFL